MFLSFMYDSFQLVCLGEYILGCDMIDTLRQGYGFVHEGTLPLDKWFQR
jgi:hypothetical protein